jgi:DNA-binding transcriptional regulator GbsR (MarR family)
MLMYYGIVDYVKIPGDRKRYFRLNHDSWDKMFEVQFREVTNLKSLVRDALVLRSKKYPETNKKIEQLYKLLELYEEEFPNIMNKWRKQVNKK